MSKWLVHTMWQIPTFIIGAFISTWIMGDPGNMKTLIVVPALLTLGYGLCASRTMK